MIVILIVYMYTLHVLLTCRIIDRINFCLIYGKKIRDKLHNKKNFAMSNSAGWGVNRLLIKVVSTTFNKKVKSSKNLTECRYCYWKLVGEILRQLTNSNCEKNSTKY